MQIRYLIFAECGCNEEGSVNDACDQTSGQCTCKPGFSGIRCQGKLNLNTKINFKAKMYKTHDYQT